MICDPSVGEEQDADFETLFAAVRNIFWCAIKEGLVGIYEFKNRFISKILVNKKEGNYIDLHTHSYSKETNWCLKRKEKEIWW